MNKKENRGITLVALVITIIVLIILAGVSINAVMNGGLIFNAKNARDEYNKAKKDEEGKLSDLEADMQEFNIETPYKLKNGYITGVVLNDKTAETVNQFESKLPEGYEVYSILGAELTNAEKEGSITTGMILKKDEEEIGKIIIYGDLECGEAGYVDGNITINDAYAFPNIFRGINIDNSSKVAADVNHDNIINWSDEILIKTFAKMPNIPLRPKINQNIYATNPDIITIESEEESKQIWVNSLNDTVKAKFEWQEEKNTYVFRSQTATVKTLLDNMPGAAIVGDTILGAEETILEGYKIMLYPSFETTDSSIMLEIGTIQIVE